MDFSLFWRQGWFLVRPLFPDCKQPPSAVSSQALSSVGEQRGKERGRELSDVFSSSYKDSSPVGAPLLRPHLSLIISLKTLSPNTVTLGARVSIQAFGEDTI